MGAGRGRGEAKAIKKKFTQEVIKKKIYSYGFCPKKDMPKEEKKKDFHLTCTRSVMLVVP